MPSKPKKKRTAARAQLAKPAKRSRQAPLLSPATVLTIGDQDLVLLETESSVAMTDLEDVVFKGFWACREMRKPGTQWFAFSGFNKPHWSGKNNWIGFSANVPPLVIDMHQAFLEKAGLEVEREGGRVLHNGMIPLARLGDEGLEILVPQPLAGDLTHGRTGERGGVAVAVRAFLMNMSSQRPAMDALLYGK